MKNKKTSLSICLLMILDKMKSKVEYNNLIIRRTITKAIIFIIISIFMFYGFNPQYRIYMLVMVGIWAILFLNYNLEKNKDFYLTSTILCICNLTALIVLKLFVHHTLHRDWINITVFLIYVFCLAFMSAKVIYFRTDKIKEEYDKNEKVLFGRRKYDLERLENFVKSVDSIGINGIWGSGKSFLVNQLKKQLSKEYVFINVDLISCNLDELQIILLDDMERILYENKIVSTYSTKLKRLLQGTTKYQILQMLLLRDRTSYSDSLKGLIQEINKLDKTIIIVYEDIDRISNKDIVKKIFSISEEMISKNIKIIYQYDENNLNQLGFDRKYLDKYIPFVVNLTPIKFTDMIESVLQYQKIDKVLLKKDDFNNLIHEKYINTYLRKTFEINFSAYCYMDYVPIRKVEHFIQEIEIMIKEKIHIYGEKNKNTIINFIFVKHFYTELYNKLNLEYGLLDTIKFDYEGKQYTIHELISINKNNKDNKKQGILSSEQTKKLFEMDCNREKLFLISVFEYDFEIDIEENNYNEIVNEPPINISKKSSNEKKDRLMWNLLCNGKSEYTNYETAAKKFIDNVLLQSRDEWEKNYNEYYKKMYQGKFQKEDNNTIFRFGITPLISLAQAIRGSDNNKEVWKLFIEFYLNHTKKSSIDIELIQILNYCDIRKRRNYIDILMIFNKLNIDGNMNAEKSYQRFLKYYLEALTSLGYVNTLELWRLDKAVNIELEICDVTNTTKYIIENITDMRDRIKIFEIQTELDIILEFINKNIELVKRDPMKKDNKRHIHSEILKFPNQKEFDRLAKMKQLNNKDFMKELEKSYKEQHIEVYEVNELMKL